MECEREEDGSELATVEPIQESNLPAVFGKDADPFEVHSFSLNDATEAMLYVNAVGGETEPMKDLIGQEIEVSYYYAKPITFAADKNDSRYAQGELVSAVRMVLVTPDGRQIATTSPTAQKIVGALHRTPLGKKRFNPPIRFRVGKARTRGGWDTQTLTVLPPKPKETV